MAGETFDDLTKINCPLGLLHPDTANDLEDWPHGWEVFTSSGEWVGVVDPPLLTAHTFRAKPAPVRVERYVNLYADECGAVHSTRQCALGYRFKDCLVTLRISCNADGSDPQIERVVENHGG